MQGGSTHSAALLPMRPPLLLPSLLIGISVAYGQPARPPKPFVELPQYRFYGGLAYALRGYQVVSPVGGIRYVTIAGIDPAYAYVGYQFNPYLAMQVGFCQHNPLTAEEMQSGFLPNGNAYTSSFHTCLYDAAVPVQLRYRLTRRRQQRLHLDALVGITTVFHRNIRGDYTTTAGQTTYTSYTNERSTNFCFAGGLALGYAIGHHLDALGQLGACTNLETLQYEYVRQFIPDLSCELRYKFGRKP